jgi:hypothetical protein
VESNHTFLFSSYLATAESAATESVAIESACAATVESTVTESATASDLEPPHADKPTIVATKANANTFFIF